MFIKNWQRQEIFEKIPSLKINKKLNTEITYFIKKAIPNPTYLEYWNFFVENKKVKYLTEMAKDISANSLNCFNGDNAIDVAIQLKYPPLTKEVLKTIYLFKLITLDNESFNVFDKLFNCDFTSYKFILNYIKEENAQSFFNSKHMHILLSSELNKMTYFEKTFPGLFLSLFDDKIDNINPHFQHILLKRNSLFKKLNLKLRKKNNKKQLLKI